MNTSNQIDWSAFNFHSQRIRVLFFYFGGFFFWRIFYVSGHQIWNERNTLDMEVFVAWNEPQKMATTTKTSSTCHQTLTQLHSYQATLIKGFPPSLSFSRVPALRLNIHVFCYWTMLSCGDSGFCAICLLSKNISRLVVKSEMEKQKEQRDMDATVMARWGEWE